MPMRFGLFAILLFAIAGGLLACGTSNSSSSSSTGLLYLATQGDASVSIFEVNLGSGVLSASGTSVPTGTTPSAMALSPSGNALFVANRDSNNISRYTVNSDGTLTAASGSTGTGTTPVALAINPAGTFLFAANQGTDDVSVFSISGSGLTEVSGSPFPTSASPNGLAVSPSGTSLYVSNNVSGTVSAYIIDSSGALTTVPGSPFLTSGTTPAGLAVAPNGNFLYVANFGSSNITTFTICTIVSSTCPVADGSLIQVGVPTAAGLGPIAMAIEPTGVYLYVADENSNQVSGYIIGSGNGALTPTIQAAAATGNIPVSIGIQPQGNYVYTANIGASTVSGFHIDLTTGTLGPLTPLTTGSQPAALALK